MASLTIRIPEDEKSLIQDFARFRGKSVSNTIRDIVLEKLEDEYDMKVAREYDGEQKHVTHSWEDVKKELGL
ncbi:MAG: DUF6290 family protein [Coriobacteriales bacterium]|jgi:predicted DNA-binding protein|nr:DUF6290 family protein [Coriobacteriales bacterium]